MKRIFFFVLIILPFAISAQTSGYLGKRNYIELKASAVPSYRSQNLIRDDVAIKRHKYTNLSYRATLNRVVAKNFELSLGYEYANINCISDGSIYVDEDTLNGYIDQVHKNILDDPKMTYHGFQFAFNFYRLGSLAPIGKFIGLSFSYGFATMLENEAMIIGQRDELTKNSFFKEEGPIANQETKYLEEEIKVSSFHLKGRIGRNYPISDHFMISVGMSFPLISTYKTDTHSRTGFRLNPGYDFEDDTNWDYYTMAAVKYYNRLSFDLGLRFHF